MGDRFTEEQANEFFRDAPIKDGMFDYTEFINSIKHGVKHEIDETKKCNSMPTVQE